MRNIFFIFLNISIFFLVSTSSCFAGVILTYPQKDTIVEDDHITFKWENEDQENAFNYIVAIGPATESLDHWFASYSYTTDTNSYTLYNIPSNISGKINWEVQYCPKIGDDTNCHQLLSSNIQSFNFKKIEKEVQAQPTKITPIETNTSIPTVKVENTIPESINWNVNTGSVLGIATSSICKFKYVIGHKEAQVMECNLPNVKVTESNSSYTNDNSVYTLVKGDFPNRIDIAIDIYECKKSLFNPSTWFKCDEVFVETKSLPLFPNISMSIENDGKNISINSFKQENDSFEIVTKEYAQSRNLRLKYTYTSNIDEYGIDIRGGGDILLDSSVIITDSSKPFVFPLENLTGVTQWYGNTAYEQPHTGIDFGAKEENVLAVSDGEVVAKGWDNYNGECMSGGNYLVIHQSNGMYTVYFHLQETYVDVGEKVKARGNIALSGNTGSWNCQPLGYHLHFETRLQRAQSSNVNPVQYINVDWDQIHTLGFDLYPERLSGENPHPGG